MQKYELNPADVEPRLRALGALAPPIPPDVDLVKMCRAVAVLEQFAKPPGVLWDLGCGSGFYSIVAQRLGWDVTAVDARSHRMQRHYGGVRWIVADVSSFDWIPADVVFLFGLLYHLPLARQQHLLRVIETPLLIVDTHVAMPKITPEDAVRLGPLYKDGQFEGRDYREAFDLKDLGTSGGRGRHRSAFNNLTSFWPTPTSLEKLLTDAGYNTVMEIVPWSTKDRNLFVAIRGGQA